MYRYFVFLIIILLHISCEKDNTADKMNISILSYNVAGLPEGLSSSHPATNTVKISKKLYPYQVIHVQEDFCYHTQLSRYDDHAHRTLSSGCVPGGDGLNTFSDFAIINFKRVNWKNCHGTDCLTPKGFSYSQLIINGQHIDFYNVHANAGTAPGDLLARQKNIRQLVDFMHTNTGENACLVFGDFNCRYTRDDDDIRRLLDEGYDDVWLQLVRNNSIPEKGAAALTACDDKNHPNCEVVDKVFYKSDARVEIVPSLYQLDDSTFYDSRGNPLSDHYPLRVDFTFNFK